MANLNPIDFIERLIDRLDKTPLVVFLALAISHGLWMTLAYMEVQTLRVQDLKELRNTTEETIQAQNKALEMQDSLIKFYGRELSRKLQE